MRISTEQKQKLIDLIKAELVMATALQEILQREFDILSGDSPEQIEAISKEKLAQMQQLTQQLAKRDQLLTILRLPPGKAGTDMLMRQLPKGHELFSHWEQLQRLSAELQQQNTINGGIVAAGQRRAKQALDILRGKHNIPETYGPGGESRTDATPSSLAKA
jgi:flagellar biosynthesis/type III secretory pathway chaperone